MHSGSSSFSAIAPLLGNASLFGRRTCALLENFLPLFTSRGRKEKGERSPLSVFFLLLLFPPCAFAAFSAPHTHVRRVKGKEQWARQDPSPIPISETRGEGSLFFLFLFLHFLPQSRWRAFRGCEWGQRPISDLTASQQRARTSPPIPSILPLGEGISKSVYCLWLG